VVSEPIWRLPADIDRLVQAVYAGDPFAEEDRPEFLATLDKALGVHYAENQKQRQLAIDAAINAEAEPQNAYQQNPRANEEREEGGTPVVTRLGDDSLTTVPVLVADDGWRLFASDPPFDPARVLDDALARRIFARQVRISRKGLLHALLALPLPKGFDEHPLLRHLHPLPLTDGVAEIAGLWVRLDPELGLVYEPLSSASEAA
jgi:CRISPR-associated endonuclease/helicase Cas3